MAGTINVPLRFNTSYAITVSADTKTLSAELDRIQITITSSNTFDAGKVNILIQ